MHSDLLIFSLGQQLFALPVARVSTVLPRASLTPLPGAPAELIGMLRLRGAVVPVIDIRPRLGLPVAEPRISECIVLMQTGACRIGLLVDGVDGIVSITPDQYSDGLVRRVLEASDQVVVTLDTKTVVAPEVAAYLAAIGNEIPIIDRGPTSLASIGTQGPVTDCSVA